MSDQRRELFDALDSALESLEGTPEGDALAEALEQYWSTFPRSVAGIRRQKGFGAHVWDALCCATGVAPPEDAL